jgi:YesN/AraC family two-component response regulator
MAGCVRVLIVDDQLRARQGLKALLATWPRLLEIKEATNGKQALDLVQEYQPDLVLMDVRMPEMDGLEATRQIKASWPNVLVVVLSMYPEYEPEATAAKADAFVCKGEPPEVLLDTLTVLITALKPEIPAGDQR